MEKESILHSSREKGQDFFFQSEQDGLFFGLEFLNHLLSSNNPNEQPEITAFVQDGDCIFKEQKILGLYLQAGSFQKEDVLSALSYFSGVYTLVSCFVERQWDFSIIGSSSANFPYSEWEEKAILKAGALVQKVPDKMYESQEELLKAIEKGETRVTLNTQKINLTELKKILQDFSHIKFSLYGPFFPEQMEEFRNYNISSVYPLCLQGSFPRLKMKVI